ncbi:unnamed protein product [Periconia digitata]|uniref:Uncharacterized protein n=1 Tax=Periconia digitata TaxID=1303443 RepID=A0A9W4UF11_9PLEO|nr:unnamed protein product [Periconia digitata]
MEIEAAFNQDSVLALPCDSRPSKTYDIYPPEEYVLGLLQGVFAPGQLECNRPCPVSRCRHVFIQVQRIEANIDRSNHGRRLPCS